MRVELALLHPPPRTTSRVRRRPSLTITPHGLILCPSLRRPGMDPSRHTAPPIPRMDPKPSIAAHHSRLRRKTATPSVPARRAASHSWLTTKRGGDQVGLRKPIAAGIEHRDEPSRALYQIDLVPMPSRYQPSTRSRSRAGNDRRPWHVKPTSAASPTLNDPGNHQTMNQSPFCDS
jgi:hypothetical protein